MIRLKKYIEWMSRGRRTNRIAYVMKEWDLPMPVPGAEWRIDEKFSAADELLRDPELKTVFKAALEKGVEVITRRE
jgi:hypothetical protein